MPENMQADVPQSRQAVFVRCCLKVAPRNAAFVAALISIMYAFAALFIKNSQKTIDIKKSI